jgi:hypothetical protein
MSVTYYTASTQASFTAAVTVGLPVWEPVLPVPNEKTLFRQSFMQVAASYVPLTLDTAYPAAGSYGVPSTPTYYLVAEDNFTDKNGGLLQWDRVYCKVPTSWTDAEEYVFTFPGFIQTATGGSDYTVTAITASGSNFQLSTSLTYTVGDSVYLGVQYVRNGITYFTNQQTKVVSGGSSGTTMNVPPIFVGTGAFTSVSGVVNKRATSRVLEVTEVVGSSIVNDYALSSVSALDTDLPIIRQFAPVDALGQTTTQLNPSTIPTAVTYLSMINNGVQIAAQNSVRRRFQGNIYVRTTRYVPAT